jgi:hypothetical protein
MTKPSHGRLYEQSDGNWIFYSGNKYELSKGIHYKIYRRIVNNF